MNTTNQYLNAVKERFNLPSDYAVAKKLGITQQAVSLYRLGKSQMDEKVAFKVASALQIDPAQVIVAAQIEREKKPEIRAVWESIFTKLGGVAASSLLAFALPVAELAQGSICIMSNKRRSKKHSPFSIFGQLSACH